MIEVTKMFSHYNFCKIETTFQCLQGFQRVKVDEGVKLRKKAIRLSNSDSAFICYLCPSATAIKTSIGSY